MSFIYLISLIALFLSMVLLKKTEKKQNILISIIYSSCIIFFLDSLFAYILSLLNINNSLLSFSFLNLLLVSVILIINYKKNKKITYQKYYLNKKELYGLIIILIICFIFGLYRYSGFKSIKYNISDAAVHYKMSKDYGIYGKLFDDRYKDAVYGFGHTMFGYYVPCGLFMKVMPIATYQSYNIFNTLMLCLFALVFYATLLFMKKDSKHNIFTVFLTILYTAAYPLNYMLFGFGYLGSGILATNMIILTWKYIQKYKENYMYINLALINFGLFFSYYLFVPATFLAEGLFMIYLFIKEEYKITTLLKNGIISLIIPTLLGFSYFIISSKGVENAISNYSIDGFSYKNLIDNYVLLIPLIIYALIEQLKKKKVDFDLLFLISIFLYIIGTFIFIGSGHVSPYYFYKAYYILWIIVNMYIYRLVHVKKYKIVLKVTYILVCICIMFSVYDIEKIISDKNHDYPYSGTVKKLGDIYSFNTDMIVNGYSISAEKLNLILSPIKYSKECKLKKQIAYAGNYSDRRWFYMITNIIPDIKKEENSDVFGRPLKYEEFTNSKKDKCLLISYDYFKDNKVTYDINYKEYKILYKNKYGKLIRKK